LGFDQTGTHWDNVGWHIDIKFHELQLRKCGRKRRPPEDVDGSYSFAEFARIMSDPTHKEHLEMWRWHGGPFDPRGFDISAVNDRIRRLP
jgi:hypothetical protein